MNKQIVGLFDRFYNIALKDKIQDPLLHSEWNYFQSMLASNNFQRERINMYLSILEKQKKKKEGVSQFQYNSYGFETKMQKRFSEPAKNNNFALSQMNMYQNKQQQNTDILKNQKMMTPKAKDPSKKFAGWDSKQRGGNGSNTKQITTDDKPNYRKLCDAANNLIRLFEVSVID